MTIQRIGRRWAARQLAVLATMVAITNAAVPADDDSQVVAPVQWDRAVTMRGAAPGDRRGPPLIMTGPGRTPARPAPPWRPRLWH